MEIVTSTTCRSRLVVVVAALSLVPAAAAAASSGATSAAFKGSKVNQGTVTHTVRSGQSVLTLSDDFQAPASTDPHWRVVDSHGMGYLLQRVVVRPDKVNRMIVVPQYVKDVVKVQIWDAFAETLLGEASFGTAVAMRYDPASAKAIMTEGNGYDESRMLPRDDAVVTESNVPLQYDDSTMLFHEVQGRKPAGQKSQK